MSAGTSTGTGGAPAVYADAAELSRAAAARLLTVLAAAQAARGSAAVVLTGGRTGAAVYAAVRDSPDRAAVDWSRVDVWWSDERFLPAGHADRNETQARAELLDALPFDPRRVHPMPAAPAGASDGTSDGVPDASPSGDPEAEAAGYAAALAAGGPPLPPFDLLLLGVGEDGHVASIFPGYPTVDETRLVCAVLNSPKPPPVRLTLTLPAINSAREVWLIATGAEKAGAVALALGGAGHVPAARVRGVERTIWMLDRAAAAQLP